MGQLVLAHGLTWCDCDAVWGLGGDKHGFAGLGSRAAHRILCHRCLLRPVTSGPGPGPVLTPGVPWLWVTCSWRSDGAHAVARYIGGLLRTHLRDFPVILSTTFTERELAAAKAMLDSF